jgi:hypothetical protein
VLVNIYENQSESVGHHTLIVRERQPSPPDFFETFSPILAGEFIQNRNINAAPPRSPSAAERHF